MEKIFNAREEGWGDPYRRAVAHERYIKQMNQAHENKFHRGKDVRTRFILSAYLKSSCESGEEGKGNERNDAWIGGRTEA